MSSSLETNSCNSSPTATTGHEVGMRSLRRPVKDTATKMAAAFMIAKRPLRQATTGADSNILQVTRSAVTNTAIPTANCASLEAPRPPVSGRDTTDRAHARAAASTRLGANLDPQSSSSAKWTRGDQAPIPSSGASTAQPPLGDGQGSVRRYPNSRRAAVGSQAGSDSRQCCVMDRV
jgi:hypothetical protein